MLSCSQERQIGRADVGIASQQLKFREPSKLFIHFGVWHFYLFNVLFDHRIPAYQYSQVDQRALILHSYSTYR